MWTASFFLPLSAILLRLDHAVRTHSKAIRSMPSCSNFLRCTPCVRGGEIRLAVEVVARGRRGTTGCEYFLACFRLHHSHSALARRGSLRPRLTVPCLRARDAIDSLTTGRSRWASRQARPNLLQAKRAEKWRYLRIVKCGDSRASAGLSELKLD